MKSGSSCIDTATVPSRQLCPVSAGAGFGAQKVLPSVRATNPGIHDVHADAFDRAENMPIAHRSHCVCAPPSLHVPGGHAIHASPGVCVSKPALHTQCVLESRTVTLVSMCVFAGHAVHLSPTVSFGALYVPSAHARQSARSNCKYSPPLQHVWSHSRALCLPVEHDSQVMPFTLTLSDGHLMVHGPVLPGCEVKDVAHCSHPASPVCVLNFPDSHSVQAPPLTPVLPTLQMQSFSALPAPEYEFDGHDWHSDGAIPRLYFPGAHNVHDSSSSIK